MKPALGLAFRLAGPLLQAVCVVLLFAVGGRPWRIGPVPVVNLLYAGFGVGFVLVVLGLLLSRPTRPPAGPSRNRLRL